MNARTIFTTVSVALTIGGLIYDTWMRKKLKNQVQHKEGEILRRDWVIASSSIDYNELDENQRSIREMLQDSGQYAYAAAPG